MLCCLAFSLAALPPHVLVDDAAACCAACYTFGPACLNYTFWSDGSRQCFFHSSGEGAHERSQRLSGAVQRSAHDTGVAAQAWAPNGTYAFDKAKYHVTECSSQYVTCTDFPKQDIHVINGTVYPDGGVINLHSANGTFPDTRIHFGSVIPTKYLVHERNISTTLAGKLFKGRAILINSPLAVPPVHELQQMIWYVPGIENSSLPYPPVAGFLVIGPNYPGPPPTPAPPTPWVPANDCDGGQCAAGSLCCRDPLAAAGLPGACYTVAACSDLHG
jgi:hypothetical protein